MTLQQMHVAFRQYAQQMGMQNVRAILPEQIDLLLNTAINDTVNQIIKENIGITNDRVITDNSKIGQINALRYLYRVQEIGTTGNPNISIVGTTTSEHDSWKLQITLSGTDHYIYRNDDYSNFAGSATDTLADYLFLVDFAINYKTGSSTSTNITRWFPVRLIDDAFLADTLNDFILAPRYRSPIATLYNASGVTDATTSSVSTRTVSSVLDLYFGQKNENIDLGSSGLYFNKLRVSYIAKPVKVAYLLDVNGHNTDCDLPDYMHDDIVRRAVDLYRVAVNGNLYSSQQQEQAQQREIARNNYRNEQQQ